MSGIYVALLALVIGGGAASGAGEMRTFAGCSLVETPWADGDSFLVRFPDGEERTLRLYGIDCIEYHVHDETDARRLRAQRRYFGMSNFGGGTETSVAAAKRIGAEARAGVRKLLAKKFSVTTAFADARGDGKYKRYYAYIQLANGKDLGEELVKSGLARAFGVNRNRPGVQTSQEYRERVKDLELRAAKLGKGAWRHTDWEALPNERKEERDDAAELKIAKGGKVDLKPASINPNTAARDELMRLPGIGETIANRIIEGRADRYYRKAEDLSHIDGIGVKTIENIRAYLTFARK